MPYFDGKMCIQNNGYDGLSVSFAFNELYLCGFFCIYKMVDGEHSTEDCRLQKVGIEAIIKNLEMLTFFQNEKFIKNKKCA